MKTRSAAFAFSAFCIFLLAACKKPADFTGFWKGNCTDAFGVQIKKQPGKVFSVSFCGPGGCDGPGEWMPNTRIVGDPKYRLVDATTLEIQYGEGWHRFTKCTMDTNPVLDYATMPSANNETAGETAAVEANRENSSAQSEKDPHRPPCTGASCQKIRAFLKKNYCGESPFANGPERDDSCDVRNSERHNADIKVTADYDCKWDESKGETECKQSGQVSTELRNTLVHQLELLGMPARAPGETLFRVWQANRADWLVAQAYYSRRIESDIELCEVIAIVDKNARVIVLRKLPFKRTDIDVPDVTDWTLLDLADTRGNGEMDVILIGDAYEDHWFEVISVQTGSAKTIFSGLGYYL